MRNLLKKIPPARQCILLNPVLSGNYSVAHSAIMQTETIQITSELLALISEVDEFKGTWRAGHSRA
jgi:hypothetical protein